MRPCSGLLPLAVLLAAPAGAALPEPALRGVALGMTAEQAVAALRASGAGVQASVAPCAQSTRSCTVKLVAGPFGEQTTVLLVEDLPAAPGTTRVYAVHHQHGDDGSSTADVQARLQQTFGRPDCDSTDANGVETRVWTAGGPVERCGFHDYFPQPVIDDLFDASPEKNAASPYKAPLLWERIAGDGYQAVLIDLGFYEARTRPAAARP